VPSVITDARTGTSREMANREKYYIITMAFRMACFISMFFLSGWIRWVVLGGAVFLPIIAVLFANQANTKSTAGTVERAEPSPAPQLTAGSPAAEVIEGELATDDAAGPRRSARATAATDEDDERWTERDRVA
jgi:hypothetical protein